MRRRGESGLTLVEMLVVLAIIGIVGSIAVLGVGGDRSVNVEAEAQRLASEIRQASDSALVTDRPVTFAWDSGGYSFSGAERRELPSGVQMTVPEASSPILFSPDGPNRALSIGVAADETAWLVKYDGFNVTVIPDGG